MESVGLDYITSKIKTKSDIIDFFREIGLYFPKSPGYDSKFFFQVLQGTKKLLPLGALGGYKFEYFTKSNSATKNHILQLFTGDQTLLSYLPDDIKLISLNRELLLSILYHANRDKYLQLYNLYKGINYERSNGRLSNFSINISGDIKAKLDAYISSSQIVNKHVLNIKKGGNNMPMIQQKNEGEKAEKNIPKINYNENGNIHINNIMNAENNNIINDED